MKLLTRMIAVGLILGSVQATPVPTAWAESAKSRYLQGDACYRDLRNDPRRQKYRDQWMECIRKFEGVYRFDPTGPWAAAGLYMSGKLYLELYRRSGRAADLREARDIFERIVKRYPDSRYQQRAGNELKTLGARSPSPPKPRDNGKLRSAFEKAEDCYRRLKADARRVQYRDQWLRCIDGFDKVHRSDPDGPFAPAALYMAGRLYDELADRSYLHSDRSESVKRLDRLRRDFPQSDYAKRAYAAPDETKAPPKATPAEKTSPAEKALPAVQKRFDAAETCYRKLRDNTRKQKYREFWLDCIEDYETAYKGDPDGPLAAVSLFQSAELYRQLHGKSYLPADLEESRRRFEQVWKRFPDTEYGVQAADAIGIPESRRIARKEAELAAEEQKREEITDAPDPIASVIQKAGPAKQEPGAAATGEWVLVEGLRYWSNPSYTRVVIDANQETDFSHHLLKKDLSLGKPQRLYVDLDRTRLGTSIQKTVPIDDDLLMDARAGQYTPDSVRVVVDIKSFETYKIFSLKNPFRIVIDVWGERKSEPSPARIFTPEIPEDGTVGPNSLARQLALGVSRIVVDPGHGGKDFGAPGYLRGVHEKKIVLEIGLLLAEKLRKRLRCEVVMTRSTDRYLTLEERTAIANTKNADLFISIHTNSARSRKAYGIETYFLNLATDEDAIRVAAIENATSTKNISDLQTILSDLMKNAKINESSRLAGHVQSGMVDFLKKRYSRIRNKGVKQAPFYVLLGAQMPAILVETSFISNPRECKRLVNPQYQDHLTDAIAEGIVSYIKETNPAAFSDSAFGSGNRGG